MLKGKKLCAPVVDAVRQKERIGMDGEQVKWRARVGELPVVVRVEVGEEKAGGVVEGGMREWRELGYRD